MFAVIFMIGLPACLVHHRFPQQGLRQWEGALPDFAWKTRWRVFRENRLAGRFGTAYAACSSPGWCEPFCRRRRHAPNADGRRSGQSSLPYYVDNGHSEPSPIGVGKSCALDHKACREDFSIAYHRVPPLFAILALARGDGRYSRILEQLAKTDLLVFGDWGPETQC